MKIENNLQDIIRFELDPGSLWSGQYKIPWDDPEFSRRMLAEHLSQEHDLASRRQDAIAEQVQWMHQHLCSGRPQKLLDLGCGPGFYLKRFAKSGYDCTGIDFSPASIEYAREQLAGTCRLVHGDIRFTDFGNDYEMVILIYGELNVFSPEEINSILRKAYSALSPIGLLVIEPYSSAAVQKIGQSPNSWYKTSAGLFSDRPHVCLIENHWFEEQATAAQVFYVIDTETGGLSHYRSTTKCWSDDDHRELLTAAGFTDTRRRDDWPSQNADLMLWTAKRS